VTRPFSLSRRSALGALAGSLLAGGVRAETGAGAGADLGGVTLRVAYYKVPGYIAFVDALPLTSTQKIQRGKLKTLVARLLTDPATVDTRSMKKSRAA